MKLSTNYTCAVLCSFLSLANLQAQDEGNRAGLISGGESVISEVTDATTKVSPGDALTNVQDNLQVDNPRLKLFRERARSLIESQVLFHSGVTEGTIDPWADIRAEWPTVESALIALKTDHQTILQEKDPDKRKALLTAFIEALQIVGPYLDEAVYQSYDLTLTPQMIAELDATEAADQGPAAPNPKGNVLQSQTPGSVFTILHLSVPISVKAAPEAEVYFTAHTGGVFENRLSSQMVKADEYGIARTSWVSVGDSTGLSHLSVTSPQCVNSIPIDVQVVQLTLTPLPELSALSQ